MATDDRRRPYASKLVPRGEVKNEKQGKENAKSGGEGEGGIENKFVCASGSCRTKVAEIIQCDNMLQRLAAKKSRLRAPIATEAHPFKKRRQRRSKAHLRRQSCSQKGGKKA